MDLDSKVKCFDDNCDGLEALGPFCMKANWKSLVKIPETWTMKDGIVLMDDLDGFNYPATRSMTDKYGEPTFAMKDSSTFRCAKCRHNGYSLKLVSLNEKTPLCKCTPNC